MVVEEETFFDNAVFAFLKSSDSPFFFKVALLITFFGSGYFLIPAFLVVTSYQILNKRNREAIIIGIVALVIFLSGWALKDIFHRPRPLLPLIPAAAGYSFPSGHSLGGFTFSGVLIYLLWRITIRTFLKWLLSALLVLFALLIGLSRIYLRVHFASDVLGSLFLTIIWLSLTFVLFETIERKAGIL